MNSASARAWAVELDGVTKHFRGGVRALDNATVRAAAGCIAALVGPNGSGKSTALKLAAGLLAPSAGRAAINGLDAASMDARAAIGYLPESPGYPGWLSVREFLAYCGRLSGLRGTGLDGAIAARLEWAGLSGLADRGAGTLSKGQGQRLGLAQALLHDPAVLLLDEPASGLDPVGVLELAGLLGRLRDAGKTVLLSSHFLPQVEAVCDRVFLLRAGRVAWEGPPGRPGELEELFVESARADAAAR